MADITAQIKEAKGLGYSDQEILGFLSQRPELATKIKSAIDGKYSPAEIIDFLGAPPATMENPEIPLGSTMIPGVGSQIPETSEEEAHRRYVQAYHQEPPAGYPHHLAGQQGLEELTGSTMPSLMTAPGRYLLSTGVGLGAEEAARHAGLSPGMSALVGTGAGMLTGGGLRLNPRQSALNFLKDVIHPSAVEGGPNPIAAPRPIPTGTTFAGETPPIAPIKANPAPAIKPIPAGTTFSGEPMPRQFNGPVKVSPIGEWNPPGPVQEGVFKAPNPNPGGVPRPPKIQGMEELPPVPVNPTVEEPVGPVKATPTEAVVNAGKAKDAKVAEYLKNRGVTPEAWNALDINSQNAHVKAVNPKYKPLGKGGLLGRSAEDSVRDIYDALSKMWGR